MLRPGARGKTLQAPVRLDSIWARARAQHQPSGLPEARTGQRYGTAPLYGVLPIAQVRIGTASALVPLPTLAAVASVVLSGSGAPLVPLPTASAQGAEVFEASAAPQVPLPQLSAAAQEAFEGAAVCALPGLVCAGAGTVTSAEGAITGTVAAVVPVPTAQAVGSWLEGWVGRARTGLLVGAPARTWCAVEASRWRLDVVPLARMEVVLVTTVYEIKVGSGAQDTAQPFEATLTKDGAAFDLSGIQSAKLVLRHEKTRQRSERTLTVVDAIQGRVRYQWAAGDLIEGNYKGEVQVTLGSGAQQTFPNSGYFTLTAVARL